MGTRNSHAAFFQSNRAGLVDRVSRSYGMLRTARSMTTDLALAHLSNLRLGLQLKLWDGASIEVLNRVRVQIQRGHIQALHEKEPGSALLDSNERDRLRAAFLRQVLSRGQ